MNFETKVIHDGQEPEPETGAIMYPIFYTSTYVQKVPGQGRYEYSRSANPTRDRLQEALAGIEKGNYALAFASGLAAATTLMFTVQPGSRVLCCNDLYGGSYRLFRKVFEKYQIEFLFLDLTDLQNLEDALADPQSAQRTTMLWLESPSNPLLKLVDIQRASEIAHRYGITVVVDNTFATPYLQNPLDLGADLVLHSTTKYIGGHSDIIGGALIMKSESWKEQLAFLSKATGGVPSPMDAWLTLRGLKTLAVRMQAHCANARKIAQFLEQESWVKALYYPGSPQHPQYRLAQQQMRDFGGMISVDLHLTLEESVRFIQSTRLFQLAESLGGVESLIEHPASMTHASIPKEIREQSGLSDGLVRLSVGIENVEDLINDLKQAYQAVKSA